MADNDTRRRYTYRGHYVSRLSPESRLTQDSAYRPRSARHGRGLRAMLARLADRRPSRHARPGDTLLVTARRSVGRWVEAAAGLRRRLGGAFRPAALRAAWRKATPFLGAAFGILIVVLSVYLVRQGTLVPQDPITWGGHGDATPVEAGADAGTDVGSNTGDGAGSDAGDGATAPATDPGDAAAGHTGDTGEGTAGGGNASDDGDPGQLVIDYEGPTTAPLGPMSLEECFAALEPPAAGATVIQGMGWCYVEVLDAWRYHSGVDLALAEGQAVRAALDGLVTRVGSSDSEGTVVVISHGFGLETIYAHLGSAAVTEGEQVRTGHIIGWAGSPGALEADQGIHLHYQLRVDGESVDPTTYLN